ncbi:MAG TPA: hypothetical protein VK694_05090 [Verrucomicrobiae bacterium]|nr:hypothetical protein [Verrucomicrobiae bacterium]
MEFPGQRAAERLTDAIKERARQWFVRLGDQVFEAMMVPPKDDNEIVPQDLAAADVCPDEPAPPEETRRPDQLASRS